VPGGLWKWLHLGLCTDSMVKNDFSKPEIELMTDGELLLTKRKIMSKVADRFAALEGSFRQVVESRTDIEWPDDALTKAGKISRGENHKGLPYVVLDYPRLLTAGNTVHVRLLFWWGHYFGLSLHLAGHFWQTKKVGILKKLAALEAENIRFQTEGSPWENDVFSQDFREIRDLKNLQSGLADKAAFLRVVAYLPIGGAAELEVFAVEGFKNFMAILKN